MGLEQMRSPKRAGRRTTWDATHDAEEGAEVDNVKTTRTNGRVGKQRAARQSSDEDEPLDKHDGRSSGAVSAKDTTHRKYLKANDESRVATTEGTSKPSNDTINSSRSRKALKHAKT